jgi:hypothetical protein
MPWISQETFTAGDIIDVKHGYTTHHYGHIQVRKQFELNRILANLFLYDILTTTVALGMQPWGKFEPKLLRRSQ